MPPKDENSSASARMGILGLNDLKYVLEPDMSVAINATHKQHYFQQTSYTNSSNTTSICVLNSGADYVDPKRSFLAFTVRLGPNADQTSDVKEDPFFSSVAGALNWSFSPPSAATTDSSKTRPNGQFSQFGESSMLTEAIVASRATEVRVAREHGSAMNLIKQITISSRSGDEISRVDNANLLAYIQSQYMKTEQWNRTIDSSMGRHWSCPTLLAASGAYKQADANRTARFCIPLSCLSGVFNYDRLLPSQLMSGLQIRIEWERPDIAYIATGTDVDVTVPPSEYTISDIYFNLMSVQLTDSIQRLLNEHSATNGLEIVFADWSHCAYPITSSTMHAEVRQAVSRALRAIARVRYDLPSSTTMATSRFRGDSFEAERWRTSQYQWQLGSLYFPQQPIRVKSKPLDGTNDAGYWGTAGPAFTYEHMTTEPYLHTIDCVGGMKAGSQLAVSVDNVAFELRAHLMSCCLERSSLFNLSGIPINNSRVLALNFDYQFENHVANVKTKLDIFLQYVRLVRVWLTNTEVEQ